MKKWMKIALCLIAIFVLFFSIDLFYIFTKGKPLFSIKSKCPGCYRGVFYDVYNCYEYPMPQIKFKGSKFSCAVEDANITLEEVNDYILNYFIEDKSDKNNYVDLEKNKVIVGLIDSSLDKQEEVISKVFSACCGSRYVKYIKDNSIIEFVKIKRTLKNHS